jgi:hypothetical protein
MIRASTLRALLDVVRTPQFKKLLAERRPPPLIEEAETADAAWIGVLTALLTELTACECAVDNLPAKDAAE